MVHKESEELKREVGLLDVAANVVNNCIATGIFILPAVMAAMLGSAGIVAFVFCGLLFLMVVLCYVEVSSAIPETGGSYAYIKAAWGNYAGFISNALCWFCTGVFAAAALLNGLADMLSVVFPAFSAPLYRGLLFAAIIFFCTAINILGIKQGMLVVKLLTFLKLAPIIILALVGLFFMKADNLRWNGFPPFEQLGAASLILFFVFTGGECALSVGGEMKNPKRTAPLGILYGMFVVTILYCILQLVAQGILGNELVDNKAPLAAAAKSLFGNFAFNVIIATSMVSIFSTVNSIFLAYPRIMYAGAKDRQLPSFLSRTHQSYKTPHLAIAGFALIVFIVAVSGGFRQLAVIVTAASILVYMGVASAVIKLRLTKDNNRPAGFKLPGGLTIPICALLVLGCFFVQLKPVELKGFAILIALLTIIWLIKILLFKKRTVIPELKIK